MSMVAFQHTPVLMPHVLAGLAPRPHGRYLDATLGGAGHAQAVLAAAQPGGFLLGIDADQTALAAAQAALIGAGFGPSSFATRQSNFVHLAEIATDFGPFDGILLDLGVSSYQLDAPERGFAFRHDGPLDMRLDQSRGPTAADLVAELPEAELANIIFRYGEERQSRRIARRIVERRARAPFLRTADLAEVVAGASGGPRGKIHPATRTFQALRIAVNRELEHLEAVLPQAVGLLAPGGRLAVISFHSLEDRIVKLFFRAESGYGGSEHDGRPIRLRLLTRRPQEADDAEIAQNPRARSAKLRVAERIADGE